MAGGGAERAIVEIINNLDRSRYSPNLALFRKEGPYLSYINNDVPIYELNRCGGYKNTLRLRKQFSKLVDRVRPDLITSSMVGSNRNLLRATLGFSSLHPIILCEQNNLSLTIQKKPNPLQRKLINQEVNFLYSRATKVVAVSHGVKEDLVYHHNVRDDQVVVIHNPVNVQLIQASQNEKKDTSWNNDYNRKKIVAAGRLTKQKGFSDLIDAFDIVRRSVPAKLTILGEGELRNELEQQVRELGLDNHVELPGFLDEPWSVIYASDLFVLSSYWEGFGNVIAEAMACGTPIVSTDCNYGPGEIVFHNHDGILVPVGDVHAMSEAILSVFQNEEFARQLVHNGLGKVQRFDSKSITKKYERLFGQVIG